MEGADLKFKDSGFSVELFYMVHKRGHNYNLLNSIREEFPNLILEGVSQKCILSFTHARKIVSLSLFAQKQNLLLSKKLQTDILLRFAGTTQISEAIKVAGIESNDSFVLIAIGQSIPKGLHDFIAPYAKRQYDLGKSSVYLTKRLGISKQYLSAVLSNAPLEDLAVEKAAVLLK